MGSGIALDEAAVMAIALEAILYGFSLLMFIATIWALTRTEYRRTSNRTMIPVAVVLLVLSTAHMVVDILRTEEGLIKYRNTFHGGPIAFFADVGQSTYVAKNALYTLQTLVGDAVVIYRLYIVWQSVWITTLPIMLWCSVAVTAAGSVYNVSRATSNASNIFARETAQWVTAFFASTLTTNLISSGLLAYRIWNMERSTTSIRTSKSTLIPVLRVLIDAAALYSAALFAALACFVCGNHGETVAVSMIMPIISIAFYMVLIRIAMRETTFTRLNGTSVGTARGTSYGRRPIQVRVTRSSTHDFPLPSEDVEMASRSLACKGEFEGVTPDSESFHVPHA